MSQIQFPKRRSLRGRYLDMWFVDLKEKQIVEGEKYWIWKPSWVTTSKAFASAWSYRGLQSVDYISVSSLEVRKLNTDPHTPVDCWPTTSPKGNSQALLVPVKRSQGLSSEKGAGVGSEACERRGMGTQDHLGMKLTWSNTARHCPDVGWSQMGPSDTLPHPTPRHSFM